MVKGTSLGYLVSVNELIFATYKVVGARGRIDAVLHLTAALLYFVVNFAISRAAALLEKRVRFAA